MTAIYVAEENPTIFLTVTWMNAEFVLEIMRIWTVMISALEARTLMNVESVMEL